MIPCCCLLPDLGQPCASLSPAWCCSHPGRGGGRMAGTWGGQKSPPKAAEGSADLARVLQGKQRGQALNPLCISPRSPSLPLHSPAEKGELRPAPQGGWKEKTGSKRPPGDTHPLGTPCLSLHPASRVPSEDSPRLTSSKANFRARGADADTHTQHLQHPSARSPTPAQLGAVAG